MEKDSEHYGNNFQQKSKNFQNLILRKRLIFGA
jgi:hypothetical protein